jgi:hypothetical protein
MWRTGRLADRGANVGRPEGLEQRRADRLATAERGALRVLTTADAGRADRGAGNPAASHTGFSVAAPAHAASTDAHAGRAGWQRCMGGRDGGHGLAQP